MTSVFRSASLSASALVASGSRRLRQHRPERASLRVVHRRRRPRVGADWQRGERASPVVPGEVQPPPRNAQVLPRVGVLPRLGLELASEVRDPLLHPARDAPRQVQPVGEVRRLGALLVGRHESRSLRCDASSAPPSRIPPRAGFDPTPSLHDRRVSRRTSRPSTPSRASSRGGARAPPSTSPVSVGRDTQLSVLAARVICEKIRRSRPWWPLDGRSVGTQRWDATRGRERRRESIP